MVDGSMFHEPLDADIAAIFVGKENRVLDIDVPADQCGNTIGGQVLLADNLGLHLSAAFDHAKNWRLFRSAAARVFIVGVLFPGFPAEINFIGLNDAGKQFPMPAVRHRVPDLHGDTPCGVFVDFEITGKLASRKPFFRVERQRDREKPFLKRKVRMVENRVDRHAERGAAIVAMVSFLLAREWRGIARVAIRANGPVGPADSL